MELQTYLRNRINRVFKYALILLLLSNYSFAYDVDFHPTRLKTPEDAIIFLFPVLDKLRLLTFRDMSLKLDYSRISIHKREYIPGRNGTWQFFAQYSQFGGLQMITEAEFGYANQLDVNRWVFFPPTGYSVGVKPIAIGSYEVNNGSQVMIVVRTTWGKG